MCNTNLSPLDMISPSHGAGLWGTLADNSSANQGPFKAVMLTHVYVSNDIATRLLTVQSLHSQKEGGTTYVSFGEDLLNKYLVSRTLLIWLMIAQSRACGVNTHRSRKRQRPIPIYIHIKSMWLQQHSWVGTVLWKTLLHSLNLEWILIS